MRNGIRGGCLVLVLFAGAALAWGKPLADGGSQRDPDAEFLEEVGVGSSDAELLESLRNRAVGQVDADRVDRLVRALGSDNFRERDRATSELIRIGAAARERLRQAAADKDAEVATRAQACLGRLERDTELDIPRAAVRLLVRRRTDGAEEALLQYLPSARDEGEEEEVVYGLDALAVTRSRLVTAVRAALGDKSPARRAAGACIVGRRGSGEDRAAVRRLLADPSPLVRLRAAQGLLAAGDKAGLPALIALLDEPSVALSWQAEELLHWAGWGSAPAEIVGAATPEERQRCRAAWEAWYRRHGAGLDLAKPAAQRRPELLLICADDGNPRQVRSGHVFLYGCDGKPRWKLEGSLFRDAQLLPNQRVLLGERGEVTERDLRGQVQWVAKARYYDVIGGVCRRLRDGNTFIGNRRGQAWEVDAKGNETVAYYRVLGLGAPAQGLAEPYLLGNGCLAYLDAQNNLVQVERYTGRVRKKFPINMGSRRLDMQSDGRRTLTALLGEQFCPTEGSPQGAKSAPDLPEVDGAGSVVWNCGGLTGVSAARLRNGDVVVSTSMYLGHPLTPALLEFDTAGRKVWEDLGLGHVRRVRVCLPLVGLGFDQPPDAVVDWDSAARRAKGLRAPDQEMRRRAIQFLDKLGPNAAPAIPALIDALDDPDPWIRRHAEEVLGQTGEPALQPTLEALKDRRPNVRVGALGVVGVLSLRGQIRQDARPIVQSVLAALHDDNPLIRRAAAGALRHFRSAKEVVVPALVEALKDKDRVTSPSEVSVAEVAIGSLQSLGPDARDAVPALLGMAKADDLRLRGTAIRAAGSMAGRDKEIAAQVLQVLLPLLKDKKAPGNRLLALDGFYQMGPIARPAVPGLLKALKATDVADATLAKDIRVGVLEALRSIGPEAEEAIPELIAILEDRDRDTRERVSAAAALGGIGPVATGAIPALTKALKEVGKNPSLVQAADYALRRIRR